MVTPVKLVVGLKVYCPLLAMVKVPLAGCALILYTGDIKFKSLLDALPLTVVFITVLVASFTAVGVQTPIVKEVLNTALHELPGTDNVTE